MLSYRVTGNNLSSRWGCGVCGQEFTLEGVVVTQLDENKRQITESKLCDDCIKGGPDVIRKHLLAQAVHLRKRAKTIVQEMLDAAAALERDAAGEIDFPSWEEYQRMYDEWLEWFEKGHLGVEFPEELNRRQW